MNILRLAFLPLLLAAAVKAPAAPEPWRPPVGMSLWSNGGAEAPTLVPLAFAVGAVAVAACESGGDVNAVGQAGELGRLQIHPVHAAVMQTRGMDFQREGDRIRYAVALWRERGETFRAWSCFQEQP